MYPHHIVHLYEFGKDLFLSALTEYVAHKTQLHIIETVERLF